MERGLSLLIPVCHPRAGLSLTPLCRPPAQGVGGCGGAGQVRAPSSRQACGYVGGTLAGTTAPPAQAPCFGMLTYSPGPFSDAHSHPVFRMKRLRENHTAQPRDLASHSLAFPIYRWVLGEEKSCVPSRMPAAHSRSTSPLCSQHPLSERRTCFLPRGRTRIKRILVSASARRPRNVRM